MEGVFFKEKRRTKLYRVATVENPVKLQLVAIVQQMRKASRPKLPKLQPTASSSTADDSTVYSLNISVLAYDFQIRSLHLQTRAG